MVKVSPDSDKMKQLDKLVKDKKAKEKELSELEDKKKKEIDDAKKKLEAAVENIVVEIQKQEEEVPEKIQVPQQDETSLEETLEQEKGKRQETERAVSYEIKTEQQSLQQIADLYGRVKEEFEAGKPGDAFEEAKNALYHSNKEGVDSLYRESTGHGIIDMEGEDHAYGARLGALVEQMEKQTGTGAYKN